ncbi:MAG TPA: aminoglycoside phosphotransferase family protein [Candidatus Binatia bacterium]|nr:aminoglycoside phosphotransferase family protein [Candidatus Binatia bacterium]
MLDETEIIRVLLRSGLLDERTLLDEQLCIEGAQGRNRSHRIHSPEGPCYFVKQGNGPEAVSSVHREASIYQYLLSQSPRNALHDALPEFFGYHERDGLLVLGLSRGAQTLRDFYANHGRIPGGAAVAMGRALAALHRLPPRREPGGGMRFGPAWPLSIHRPWIGVLREASSANLDLIAAIQEFPAFGAHLDDLRTKWRPRTLIHFDLKADNCVMTPRTPADWALKIVDWETCETGDPSWDVGSVFCDYLSLWVHAIPVLADATPQQFLELTRFPLDRMRSPARAFWNSYVQELRLTDGEAREALLLALQYSAARLLQAAFERTQTIEHLTGTVVCMLQLSWNILERPGEAAHQLLGIAA